MDELLADLNIENNLNTLEIEMLEQLGISPATLWVVITVILVSTVLNLLLTLSVITFILRIADQIKILKDNFTINQVKHSSILREVTFTGKRNKVSY